MRRDSHCCNEWQTVINNNYSWVLVAHTYNPTQEAEIRRIVVQINS
jgi:hypothetical protein